MTRETTYFGIRLNGEARVYKRMVIQSHLREIPGGFNELITPLSPKDRAYEWGYCGVAPRQLALALLADHLQDEHLAHSLTRDFQYFVIARIDPELSWTLTASRLAEMAAALAANQLCENLGREHLAEVVDFNEYKLRKAK